MSARESRAYSVARHPFRFAVRFAFAMLALAWWLRPAGPGGICGSVGIVPVNGVSLGGLSRAVSDGAGTYILPIRSTMTW